MGLHRAKRHPPRRLSRGKRKRDPLYRERVLGAIIGCGWPQECSIPWRGHVGWKHYLEVVRTRFIVCFFLFEELGVKNFGGMTSLISVSNEECI